MAQVSDRQAAAEPLNAADPSTSGASDRPFIFESRINFDSAEDAQMVRNTLNVDPELRPEQVARELTVEGKALLIHFEAVEARLLRAATSTFCDLLGLAVRTLEAFKYGGANEGR